MNPIITISPEPNENGEYCAGTVTLTVEGCDGADEIEWEFAESPPGSGATIVTPDAATTSALLPVAGSYRFKVCCKVIEQGG